LQQIEASERGECDERNAERPESDRSGIADERELRGLECCN
jgi:hypothetical protein